MRQEWIYALVRCAGDRWLLLNRSYKPFGINADPTSWFNYDHCRGTRLWLRESDLEKLDGGARPFQQGDRMLWLFHGRRPGHAAYARKLAVLGMDEEEVA